MLLGNRPADEIAALNDRNNEARVAGLSVPARRTINNNAMRRGPIGEHLITNVPGARRW